MTRWLHRGIVAAAIISLSPFAFSDTLILRDGTHVTGYYEGGTARVVRFQTSSGVQEYDLLSVVEVQFGGDTVPSGTESAARSMPRLLTPEESARPVRSDSAARTAFTVPPGTALLVRLTDAINSEESATGETFRATLAEPLFVEGLEVAPADADIRGRIVEAEGAGRINGAAELRLELSQITINGVSYAIKTAEYQEVGESRGGETATRMGAGAGIGALVGLIAGGGKGAAIGAGVGAGTAGAVQILTKGEKLNIPAETLLEFRLSEPLMVASH
jgi:hypothetical protein